MTPRTLFRTVAIVEACTWTGLLVGMFLKYVPETTEVGVQVFGPLHGIAFIGYLLTTLLVATDREWSGRRTASGLLAAVPPLMTLPFEWWVERRDGLGDSWRLRTAEPTTVRERLSAMLVRRPLQGVAAGVLAVVVLTTAALVVGPPVG